MTAYTILGNVEGIQMKSLCLNYEHDHLSDGLMSKIEYLPDTLSFKFISELKMI